MMNGYHLKMERKYAVEFVVDIAKGKHELEAIARILEEQTD
jgi:death-on-curing protein